MPGEDATSAPRVVVGVDGSPSSVKALAFAVEEASMRGAILQILTTFPSPTMLGASVPEGYFENLEEQALAVIDEALGQVTGVDSLPSVVRTAVPESPGAALVAASRGAALLVVGSRGRGGFMTLLLGSVSSQCVQHSECPVVVVREGVSPADG
ncbi:MAG TPA: universal stress protein [Acidimicrobiales bacterium]|jgi:nucleotide-binding universal stress UspA family protein|nr:universal stress protein [Acidimicrobiales bacterium]